MKKILPIIISTFILSFLCFMTPSITYANSSDHGKADTKGLISQPTGDPSIGYPQIAIRTNAEPNPLDFDQYANEADSIADKYPEGDTVDRSKAVENYLLKKIDSGDLGHVWIILFKSSKPGDYVSYSYWYGSAYVSNDNPKKPGAYDPADREFRFQKDIKLPQNITVSKIENEIIPPLLEQSTVIGNLLGIREDILGNGTFTPLTTCSWFCGNLWNSINSSQNQVNFTSPFSNAEEHAKKWGMPFLTKFDGFANPGALAKFLNQ